MADAGASIEGVGGAARGGGAAEVATAALPNFRRFSIEPNTARSTQGIAGASASRGESLCPIVPEFPAADAPATPRAASLVCAAAALSAAWLGAASVEGAGTGGGTVGSAGAPASALARRKRFLGGPAGGPACGTSGAALGGRHGKVQRENVRPAECPDQLSTQVRICSGCSDDASQASRTGRGEELRDKSYERFVSVVRALQEICSDCIRFRRSDTQACCQNLEERHNVTGLTIDGVLSVRHNARRPETFQRGLKLQACICSELDTMTHAASGLHVRTRLGRTNRTQHPIVHVPPEARRQNQVMLQTQASKALAMLTRLCQIKRVRDSTRLVGHY